jgi:hypothetical protein
MKVLLSSVAEVAVHGPDSPAFSEGLLAILGRAPRELLLPALPFSVIVENGSTRTIALMGVRFDMLGARAKQYSVVHYADTLRHPQKADFRPGVKRFVCAEPDYTALVVRGDVSATTRGRMNLDTLRKMLQIRASLDCIAFEDGEFRGPDSRDAYGRFAREREIEGALLDEVLAMDGDPASVVEAALVRAVQDPAERARRLVARRLLEALESGGLEEVFVRTRGFRRRMPLWR